MTIRATILDTQAASLEGYWPCDDTASPLVDASGNGRDMTVVGTNFYEEPGFENAAIRFNGSSGYANVISPLGASVSVFSVIYWIKTTDNGVMLGIGSTSSAFPMVRCNLPAGGGLEMTVRGENPPGTTFYSLASTGSLNDGAWHSVAFVSDGSNATSYIDGVSVDTDTASINLINITHLSIAALKRTSVSDQIAATMQHVAVWSTALTPQEVEDIHNGVTPEIDAPTIEDLPGSPSPRYFADPLQVVFDETNTDLIAYWADASGDGNHAVGGDDTRTQDMPTLIYDVDSKPGIFIQKHATKFHGLGIPDAVTGKRHSSACMMCVTPLHERDGSITRFFSAAGIDMEWGTDGSTLSYRSPRGGLTIANALTLSMRRQVLGYRRDGDAVQIYYNGKLVSITESTVDATQSGGFLGTTDGYPSNKFGGLIHDVAMYPSLTSGGLVSIADWKAAGSAMMDLWGVSHSSQSNWFVQCVGDSMANGGDGNATNPMSWADLIRPPIDDGYEFHIEAVPGWPTASAVAAMPYIIGRKSLFAKRNNLAVVLIGTNDTDKLTPELHAAEVIDLWQDLKDEGFIVIGGSIPPRGDNASALARMPLVNAILRESTVPDFFIDAERELSHMMGENIDPDGHPLFNVDAVHPSTDMGYPIYAKYIAKKINEIILQLDIQKIRSAIDANPIPVTAVSSSQGAY